MIIFSVKPVAGIVAEGTFTRIMSVWEQVTVAGRAIRQASVIKVQLAPFFRVMAVAAFTFIVRLGPDRTRTGPVGNRKGVCETGADLQLGIMTSEAVANVFYGRRLCQMTDGTLFVTAVVVGCRLPVSCVVMTDNAVSRVMF